MMTPMVMVLLIFSTATLYLVEITPILLHQLTAMPTALQIIWIQTVMTTVLPMQLRAALPLLLLPPTLILTVVLMIR